MPWTPGPSGARDGLRTRIASRSSSRAIATRIVELDRGRLASYPGSFAAYQERKAQQLAEEAVVDAKFDKVLAHWDREGYGYHLVEEQGQVVGCGGLKRNDDPAELNLYYRLVFGAAGQGLAREAARA